MSKGRFIDLHCHSIISDGTLSPQEIAQLAEAKGLSGFALTDHDNTAGVLEAQAEAQKLGLDFLQGMELTTMYRGHKLHIICLGFDVRSDSFKRAYETIRKIKEGRMYDLVDCIKKRGADITMDMVKGFANGRPIDRYAIMKCLASLDIEPHVRDLWSKYIDPSVEELGMDISIDAEKAISMMHEAGAVTSLAHYHKRIGLAGMMREEQEMAIAELRSYGLDGMEMYYPTYTAEDAAYAREWIVHYGLIATGGSDFHGANRPGTELGTGIDDNLHIPYEIMLSVKDALPKHKM